MRHVQRVHLIAALAAALAATPAAVELGRVDVGAIVPGRYADMIAVKADPLAAISVLEKIDHVMKGGAIVH